MLEGFDELWESQVERMTIAEHRIELNDVDKQPVHIEPYTERSWSKEFERKKIDKMLQMNIIERAQTKQASSIVFEQNEGRNFAILCRLPKGKHH